MSLAGARTSPYFSISLGVVGKRGKSRLLAAGGSGGVSAGRARGMSDPSGSPQGGDALAEPWHTSPALQVLLVGVPPGRAPMATGSSPGLPDAFTAPAAASPGPSARTAG